MAENITDKIHKGGSPSRSSLYVQAAKHAPKAIAKLAELIDSRNPSVAVAAAKTLLSKVIPDLKAVEMDLKTKQPIKISLGIESNNK